MLFIITKPERKQKNKMRGKLLKKVNTIVHVYVYRLDFDDDLLNNNWTFGSTIYFIESRQKSGCKTEREREREC